MESSSDEQRWVICPICHKGNPAGTKFCQHCWGAILRPEDPVTTEEMMKVARRRESYLRRKKLFKITSAWVVSIGVIVCIILSLCYFTDIIVKPDYTIHSDSAPGEWSMFRRDLTHSGSVEPSDAVPQGIVKWTFQTGAAVRSSPAVVDGTVYFGSEDSTLYALDAETGVEKWSFEATSWIDSSPAVADGVVYFGSNDSYLYALDADNGDLIWKFDSGYPIKASPAITEEVVFIRSDDYYLYAIDKNTGIELWRFNTRSSMGSSPAVSGGIVYIGSGDGFCYALNAANGQRRLRFKAHYSVLATPAVKDGEVYIVGDNGKIHVVDGLARTWFREHEIKPLWLQLWVMGIPGVPEPPAQSGLIWSERISRGPSSSSPLLTDESMYVGSGDYLFCIDLVTQKVRWIFRTNDNVKSSPGISGSAVIVGSEDGSVYAIDSDSGEKLWDLSIGDRVMSSPAVYDGVIFIGSYDGKLYAIE